MTQQKNEKVSNYCVSNFIKTRKRGGGRTQSAQYVPSDSFRFKGLPEIEPCQDNNKVFEEEGQVLTITPCGY